MLFALAISSQKLSQGIQPGPENIVRQHPRSSRLTRRPRSSRKHHTDNENDKDNDHENGDDSNDETPAFSCLAESNPCCNTRAIESTRPNYGCIDGSTRQAKAKQSPHEAEEKVLISDRQCRHYSKAAKSINIGSAALSFLNVTVLEPAHPSQKHQHRI